MEKSTGQTLEGQNKTLKFRSSLTELILKGEKKTTWRLFDDKDLKEGEQVDFINWETRSKFATAKLVKVWEKTLGTLTEAEWEGHEKFSSNEEMYETYKKFYGRPVDENTIVKIIQFELI